MPLPTPPHAPPAGTGLQWRIQLLGGLRAERGDIVLTNFSSRSIAALLARLALFPQRSHPREELIELLWPGVALDVGRNRLRQALFTLRQLLEPPAPVPAPVLIADRFSVQVVPGALDCDVARFERHVVERQPARALRVYAGELLPGFYDDWIDDERLRLAALAERVAAAVTRDASAMADAPADPDPQGPGAPASVAAANAEVGRATLPVYLTRFFGREVEGARLRAEVLGHRLVTLLGQGGGGKTRLAVELAQALRRPGLSRPVAPAEGQAASFDFVAFVSLVNCSTRGHLLDALLAGLQLRPLDADPFEPLVAALAGRHALLVLDNFEQLSGLAEDVVAQLVARIPGLHLLVTSRRVLGIDGEREITIQPLALPAHGLALGEAAINPAVALFVDRARAVRADFHIGPSNLAAIVDVVHLLEGMPLAIELAAARTRSIAPATMAALLRSAAHDAPGERSLPMLARTGPRGGSDVRHASMVRVIEWSWRLLDASQQRLLQALTVFHGGFTAAAVLAVTCEAATDTSVQLDELVSHSLLRITEADTGSTRYANFEPVREYAALALDADAARALRARHRAWLTRWAAALPATPALAEVRAEMPNLLAALHHSLADDAPAAAIGLVLPLRRSLEDVELPADGLAALERAVERCDEPALRSQGHTLLGPLCYLAGRSDDALRHAELGLAGAAPGTAWRGRALHAAARVQWRARRVDDGVTARLDEAEALARAHVDNELLAGVHALRAFVVNGSGAHARGEALHEQALALWQQLGNQHAVNSGRYNLAVCAHNAGRHAETLDRLAVIEPSARALQDWRRLCQLLNVRGEALGGLRRWDDAAEAFRECAQLAWDTLALHELAYVLWNMPRALAHGRDPERAVLVAAFAESFWQARFGSLTAADRRDLRRVRRLATVQLDAARVAALWRRGGALPLADAMALALH